MAFWDDAERSGDLLRYFEAEKLQAELLLPYDMLNCILLPIIMISHRILIIIWIRHITDAEISDMIIDWIYEEEGLLTEDNYVEKIQAMEDYYLSFDYESIFGDMDDEKRIITERN